MDRGKKFDSAVTVNLKIINLKMIGVYQDFCESQFAGSFCRKNHCWVIKSCRIGIRKYLSTILTNEESSRPDAETESNIRIIQPDRILFDRVEFNGDSYQPRERYKDLNKSSSRKGPPDHDLLAQL